jgi:hypothetical protein
MKTLSFRPGRPISCLVMAAGLVAAVPLPTQAEADIVHVNVGTYNNRKIYLSAAFHTADPGVRGECPNTRSERNIARTWTTEMAKILVEYGYRVRTGRGDRFENTARSDAWEAGLHMPLHSNADRGSGTCASRSGSVRGTRQMYRSGDPSGLSTFLARRLAPLTPGGGDRACVVTDCSDLHSLTELSAKAPRKTYSETEFHDWNRGMTFLLDFQGRHALAMAIDDALGNPRG